MNPQVNAALISGGAALVVALLGIAGAIAAQLLATRRAYENSAALYEQQQSREEAARKQELGERIRREDVYRYAEQRRTTYAKFLARADEAHDGSTSSTGWFDVMHKLVHESAVNAVANKESGKPAMHPASATAAAHAQEGMEQAEKADVHLAELAAEIHLIGSSDVCEAADWLRRSTGWWNGSDAIREYPQARAAFVAAARRELGIQPLEPTVAGRPGWPGEHPLSSQEIRSDHPRSQP